MNALVVFGYLVAYVFGINVLFAADLYYFHHRVKFLYTSFTVVLVCIFLLHMIDT